MLIIEGPDLAGKTTLAHNLIKRLNVQGLPHVYSHLSRLPDSFHRYWGYTQFMGRYLVQDRFHMSEPVYAKMRGDESELTPYLYALVDAKLKLSCGFTVMLYMMDDSMVLGRWRDGEMYRLEQVLEVNGMYKDIAENKGWWEGYQMHYDLAIGLTPETPFVSEQTEQLIVDTYGARLAAHFELLEEEPEWILQM